MESKNKCEVSKYCGGCKYQGIDYLKQLETKYEYVNKLLNRFNKVKPILGMEDPYHYRNKVQVSFGVDEYRHVICGNYVPSSHMIVPVEDCLICDKTANEIINSIKRLVIKYKINIFDERALKGCLRHVLIRCSSNNEYMVVLVTGSLTIHNCDLLVKDILKFNPSVTTIVQNINNKHTSMILGERNNTLYGKGYITDTLCGLDFQISSSSFYQVNKRQTEVLYNEAVKAAGLTGKETLIDAYCGTGTIGMIMAKTAKRVIGVELNKDAIKDANKNMRNNKIANIEFICDDASNFMNRLAKQKFKVDVVVMDPPRTGSDIKFLKAVVSLRPEKLIYVSCNPETLKRDLDFISKYYKVNSIQPVDMFPFTAHVECVVGMQRK